MNEHLHELLEAVKTAPFPWSRRSSSSKSAV